MSDYVSIWRQRVRRFESEAHKLFSKHESGSSRVVELSKLSKSLGGLTVDVEGYYKEAISCLENGNLRAAIVMSWAGFFSVFMDKFFIKKSSDVAARYPKWKFANVEELKEIVGENALLLAAREVKFISNALYRKYDGQLSTRNLCAHPTLYVPSQNEAIGFVDLMVSQSRRLL